LHKRTNLKFKFSNSITINQSKTFSVRFLSHSARSFTLSMIDRFSKHQWLDPQHDEEGSVKDMPVVMHRRVHLSAIKFIGRFSTNGLWKN